jgi:rubrerythrin
MSKSPSAGKAADKQVKQMLLDMAAMEDGHLVTFQQMREELSDKMRAIFKSLK